MLSLQKQLNLALARRYAASSEKLSPDQIHLFSKAELEVQTEPEKDESTIVPEHSRKKLPDSLPRVDVIHELVSADRFCPHDGDTLTEVSEVISEQLDIVPAKIQVIRHIRKQCTCKCGQCIKTAPLPPQPYPQEPGIAGLIGPRHHIQIPRYSAIVSSGNHPTSHPG